MLGTTTINTVHGVAYCLACCRVEHFLSFPIGFKRQIWTRVIFYCNLLCFSTSIPPARGEEILKKTVPVGSSIAYHSASTVAYTVQSLGTPPRLTFQAPLLHSQEDVNTDRYV